MLLIRVPSIELYSDSSGFVTIPNTTIKLEHSLVSLSKWESKWHKPFYSTKQPTLEESLDYIRCMTLNPEEVNPIVYSYLTQDMFDQITEYMNSSMTATWFSKDPSKGGPPPSREIITSELIYYWMVALQIPFQPCESWHLNRLLTLVRVCNEKNKTPQKIPKNQLMSRNRALNAARRKRMHSNG